MKSFRIATAILALSTGMSFAESHSGENPMVGGAAMFADKNIIENAVNSADHTTLVAAVQAAGLVETLSGAGPFTVPMTPLQSCPQAPLKACSSRKTRTRWSRS
jgi:uncharacterized surface protein with fasciclin (FAS1) repeats